MATNPICPECGSSMILRTAMKGSHKGERFYGCSKYPSCNRIIKAPEETKLNIAKISKPEAIEWNNPESDVSNIPREELTKCSYDGKLYKKGSLCPNYSNHKSVSKFRSKRKANDFYDSRRSVN